MRGRRLLLSLGAGLGTLAAGAPTAAATYWPVGTHTGGATLMLAEPGVGRVVAWDGGDEMIPSHRVWVDIWPSARPVYGGIRIIFDPSGTLSLGRPSALHVAAGEIRVMVAATDPDGLVRPLLARTTAHEAGWRLQALPFGPAPTYPFASASAVIGGASGIDGVTGDGAGVAFIHIPPGLGSVETTAIAQPIRLPRIARGTDGTLYAVGASPTAGRLAVQAGAAARTVAIPGCAGVVRPEVAGGPTGVVILASACGAAWATTVSRAGVVGAVRRLGPASATAWPLGVRRGGSGFAAAWIGADGDVRIATSPDGGRFRLLPGVLPTAIEAPASTVGGTLDGAGGILFQRGGPIDQTLWYAPTSDRVGLPRIVTRGLAHARVRRVGTLAFAVPRSVSLRRLPTALLPFRVAASVPDFQATIVVSAYRRARPGRRIVVLRQQNPVRPGIGTDRLRLTLATRAMRRFGIRAGDRLAVRVITRNGTGELPVALTR